MVDSIYSYNAILGCTTFNLIKIVTSTCHQKMKFLTPYGIGKFKPITKRNRATDNENKLAIKVIVGKLVDANFENLVPYQSCQPRLGEKVQKQVADVRRLQEL